MNWRTFMEQMSSIWIEKEGSGWDPGIAIRWLPKRAMEWRRYWLCGTGGEFIIEKVLFRISPASRERSFLMDHTQMNTERIDMKMRGLKTTIHLKEDSGADSNFSHAKTSKISNSIWVEKAINIAVKWAGEAWYCGYKLALSYLDILRIWNICNSQG